MLKNDGVLKFHHFFLQSFIKVTLLDELLRQFKNRLSSVIVLLNYYRTGF